MIQICLALYDIHSRYIIHRKINPSSILIDSKYNIKLTNLKNAFLLEFENDLCTEEIPGDDYASPEILLHQEYNIKTDIWSLGVLLYEMCLFNKSTKDKIDEKLLYKNNRKGQYASLGNKYSKELIELIYGMLRLKYQERISINDIIFNKYFISMSKKLNLFYYVDKAIKLNKAKYKEKKIRKKKIINRDYDENLKKIENDMINNINKKEAKEKMKKNVEKLAEEYFNAKKNIEELIGKQKSDILFEEFSIYNMDEIIRKYTFEFTNSEIAEKLKILLIEYIHVLKKYSLIKNKI